MDLTFEIIVCCLWYRLLSLIVAAAAAVPLVCVSDFQCH